MVKEFSSDLKNNKNLGVEFSYKLPKHFQLKISHCRGEKPIDKTRLWLIYIDRKVFPECRRFKSSNISNQRIFPNHSGEFVLYYKTFQNKYVEFDIITCHYNNWLLPVKFLKICTTIWEFNTMLIALFKRN